MSSMIKWSMSVGQSLASKAIVDKIEIPQKYYTKIDRKLNELEEWGRIINSVDTEKPHTWVSGGLNIIRKLSVPMETEGEIAKNDPLQGFLNQKELETPDAGNNLLFMKHFYKDICKDVLPYSETEMKIEETGIIKKFPLETTDRDFYFLVSERSEDQKKRAKNKNPYTILLPRKKSERSKVGRELFLRVFWRDRNIIKIDYSERGNLEGVVFQDSEFDGRRYEGILTELYGKLRKYIKEGTRRCILFQGPPGTGKSTLAYNIAEKVSSRTIVLSKELIFSIGNEDIWNEIQNHLNPEMILVDDIDRCHMELENKLHFFEDKHCDVPLIIFTSNHYGKLPGAFKRPGRIDQIIKMVDPPEKIRHEVIKSLGKQEGVEIPKDKFPILDIIYQEYPGAYIVELIRRCGVEGWDYKIPEYGLTFKNLPDEVVKVWNGEKELEDLKEIESSSWGDKFESHRKHRENNQQSNRENGPEKYFEIKEL